MWIELKRYKMGRDRLKEEQWEKANEMWAHEWYEIYGTKLKLKFD